MDRLRPHQGPKEPLGENSSFARGDSNHSAGCRTGFPNTNPLVSGRGLDSVLERRWSFSSFTRRQVGPHAHRSAILCVRIFQEWGAGHRRLSEHCSGSRRVGALFRRCKNGDRKENRRARPAVERRRGRRVQPASGWKALRHVDRPLAIRYLDAGGFRPAEILARPVIASLSVSKRPSSSIPPSSGVRFPA